MFIGWTNKKEKKTVKEKGGKETEKRIKERRNKLYFSSSLMSCTSNNITGKKIQVPS
jgi:hypothetical protein